MDVRRHNPEIIMFLNESVQLLAVSNAGRVFVVQEDCRSVVRPDLMKRVANEIFVAHDFLVGEFVDGFLYPIEIPLELLLRGLPATVKNSPERLFTQR